jgi:fluoroquinolone transport system ATP-binding protein
VERDEIRATPLRRVPAARDDDWWECLETCKEPTRGRSAYRACQLAPPGLANDHEDGGPTIPLPAAEARCTLRSLSGVQYTRLIKAERSTCRSSASLPGSACRRSGVLHFAARQSCYSPLHAAVIDVHSFGFTYRGAQRPAVRDVAFSVEPGEIFGFLGPSGAGKSTTQNVLIRLLDGYEGTVAVLGKDLRAWDRGYYRRIGVAFEAPNHYLKLTTRENLQLFAGLHGGGTEDPGALLERVGLEQDGDKLVAEFSKGMRGGLTFARALLHRPGLLFLDEPTAGLDPVTARRIRQVIRESRDGGATVFLTTHDMVTATELCDRVAFLVDGQIAALDSPRSLRLAYGRKVVRLEAVSDGTRIAREFAIGGLADDSDFLGLLRSDTVETIHTLETTLEDVFVQVTGRPLA